MEIRFDAKDFLNQLVKSRDKIRHGIELYGKTAASRVERRAKQDARWIDRTALARQTITGAAGWTMPSGSSLTIGRDSQAQYMHSEGVGAARGSSVIGVGKTRAAAFAMAKRENAQQISDTRSQASELNNNAVSAGLPDTFVISVTGNMSYSVWLEVANEGKFAVLWPSINAEQNSIVNGFAEMMRRLK